MMKKQMKRLVSLVMLCALFAGLLTAEASAALKTDPQTDNRQLILFSAEGGFSERYTAVTNSSGRLTALPEAVRTGYTFLGWYTASQGGEMATTATVFSGNAVLYAHWA